MTDVRSYSPSLLPALVRFWNRGFSDRRNFFPVTEEIVRRRVIEKRTSVERFEPSLFLVAVDGDEIVGAIHAGIRPEELCRVLHPEWPGGTQGYIALFFVQQGHRNRGVGTELWRRAHSALSGVKQVVLDGQCLNPFYGNSEGPFTPFWGTPEGISVLWSDSATKRFFARRGYAPRFKALQLEIAIDQARFEAPEAAGLEVRVSDSHYPDLDTPYPGRARYAAGGAFECAAALQEGRTVGVLSWYPLAEVEPGRYAIFEALVAERMRGKGVGRTLLAVALRRMREAGARRCDVLTIPEVSEAAYRLYLEAGFSKVEEWAVY